MLNIIICDDEKIHIDQLVNFISGFSKEHKIMTKVNTYSSGESLLFEIDDLEVFPDIVFLDILMGELTGIETARRLREKGLDSVFIFMTQTKDFVFDAFDVRSFHYLMKDSITQSQFNNVLQQAYEYLDKHEVKYFKCQFNSEKRIIKYKDIIFFEVFSRKVTVYYNDEAFTFYGTIRDLTKEFENEGFVRANRACLVNMQHITSFDEHTIYLSEDFEVPIGNSYHEEIFQAYQKHIDGSWF